MRSILLNVFLFLGLPAAGIAEEPFLKPNDVIVLVGGEDMVAAAEYGYLELLLTRALPEHKLKFRCLAWEGDTVFEQRRDLNFPTWEQQLDSIGATVVICQFGQMESLAGPEKRPEFIAAYEKLIDRFSGGGKRRVVILEPFQFAQSVPYMPEDVIQFERHRSLVKYQDALDAYCAALAERIGAAIPGLEPLPGADVNETRVKAEMLPTQYLAVSDAMIQRDGMHLNALGHQVAAAYTGMYLNAGVRSGRLTDADRSLLPVIISKNTLWDRYWRPQNWAFLAGDRTTQASSRDHLDPSKRWFPAEREEFLPLIEIKEQEIWALASQLK